MRAKELPRAGKKKSHKKRSMQEPAASSSAVRNEGTARSKKVTLKQKRPTIGVSASRMTNFVMNGNGELPDQPLAGVHASSIDVGKSAFEWLIAPISTQEFFKTYWERKPLLINRQADSANYYGELMSFAGIDKLLRRQHVDFTTNIDITSYKDGKRETLNPDGRATAAAVWSFFDEGCSVRMLNPHNYFPQLYKLNSELQEYFACFVGANSYLTPPRSQGFAPHWDDIEAFVLQIEGTKRWKLHAPVAGSTPLPRFSSHNFEQKELGKPELDVVLHPGELLYFPRGTIHQASTMPGSHSLHITLSVYQKHSYADLLEKLVPAILSKAIQSEVRLRQGLPLHTFQQLGYAHSGQASQKRESLKGHIQQLVKQCLAASDDLIDDAVDQLAVKFQHEALPPKLTPAEHWRTVFGVPTLPSAEGCVPAFELTLNTKVRLLRAHIVRIVKDESGGLALYYYLDNSREYCKNEPNFLELEPTLAGAVQQLIHAYPKYLRVGQLQLADDEAKLNCALPLWERGLLMTKQKVNQGD